MASIATCPLDVIKTKLQAQRAVQGQQAYLGVFGVCFLRHPVFFFPILKDLQQPNPSISFYFMIRYVQVYSYRKRVTGVLSRIGAYDAWISTYLGYLFCCI